MTIIEKFNSIDQTQTPPKVNEVLKKMKTVSKDFTLSEANKKIEPQLDVLIKKIGAKLPDAIKPKSKVNKTIKGAKKSSKPEDSYATKVKKNRKAGESLEDAKKRTDTKIKAEKKKTSAKLNTELEKLRTFIKNDAVLKDFNNSQSDIKIDSKLRAKTRGKRYPSKGKTTNQYGTFENKVDRPYWESRENRADRYAPKFPKNKPLLERGGDISDMQTLEIPNADYIVMANGGQIIDSQDLGISNSDLLIMEDGGRTRNISRDQKFLNHSEDWEEIYSKGKEHRHGYKEQGGTIDPTIDSSVTDFNIRYAKGGRVKNYDYIAQSNISELKAKINGELTVLKNKDILSGSYVKKVSKASKKSNVAPADLYDRIKTFAELEGADDLNDVKAVLKFVKRSDIAFFQEYLSDDMIMAFYCGVRSVIDANADLEVSKLAGIFKMRTDGDWIPKLIKTAKDNCKNASFEIGFKYPDFTWSSLGKIIEEKSIKSKDTFSNGSYRIYEYKIWIYKDIVLGKNISFTDDDGKTTDLARVPFADVTKNSSYLGVVSHNPNRLWKVLKALLSQSNGYCKDIEFLVNGLGGVDHQALDKNDVKYAQGGQTDLSADNLDDITYAKGGQTKDSGKAVFVQQVADGTWKISSRLNKSDFPHTFNDTFEDEETALKFGNKVAKNYGVKITKLDSLVSGHGKNKKEQGGNVDTIIRDYHIPYKNGGETQKFKKGDKLSCTSNIKKGKNIPPVIGTFVKYNKGKTLQIRVIDSNRTMNFAPRNCTKI